MKVIRTTLILVYNMVIYTLFDTFEKIYLKKKVYELLQTFFLIDWINNRVFFKQFNRKTFFKIYFTSYLMLKKSSFFPYWSEMLIIL